MASTDDDSDRESSPEVPSGQKRPSSPFELEITKPKRRATKAKRDTYANWTPEETMIVAYMQQHKPVNFRPSVEKDWDAVPLVLRNGKTNKAFQQKANKISATLKQSDGELRTQLKAWVSQNPPELKQLRDGIQRWNETKLLIEMPVKEPSFEPGTNEVTPPLPSPSPAVLRGTSPEIDGGKVWTAHERHQLMGDCRSTIPAVREAALQLLNQILPLPETGSSGKTPVKADRSNSPSEPSGSKTPVVMQDEPTSSTKTLGSQPMFKVPKGPAPVAPKTSPAQREKPKPVPMIDDDSDDEEELDLNDWVSPGFSTTPAPNHSSEPPKTVSDEAVRELAMQLLMKEKLLSAKKRIVEARATRQLPRELAVAPVFHMGGIAGWGAFEKTDQAARKAQLLKVHEAAKTQYVETMCDAVVSTLWVNQ